MPASLLIFQVVSRLIPAKLELTWVILPSKRATKNPLSWRYETYDYSVALYPWVWTNLLALFSGNSETDDLYLIFVRPLKFSLGVAHRNRQISVTEGHSQDPTWYYFQFRLFQEKHTMWQLLKCPWCWI